MGGGILLLFGLVLPPPWAWAAFIGLAFSCGVWALTKGMR